MKKIIVDVGATGFPASSYGYKKSQNTEVYLFEPHPDFYKILKNKFENDKTITLYDIALSDQKGTSNFYLTQKGNCSSLRQPNQEVLKDRKDITQYKKIEVKTDTMDNVLGHLLHIDYLKLDAQGSEYEILLGATEVLKKTKYVKCEVEFTEWYKGQKLAKDVVDLLESRGFKKTSQSGGSSTHCDMFFEKINTTDETTNK